MVQMNLAALKPKTRSPIHRSKVSGSLNIIFYPTHSISNRTSWSPLKFDRVFVRTYLIASRISPAPTESDREIGRILKLGEDSHILLAELLCSIAKIQFVFSPFSFSLPFTYTKRWRMIAKSKKSPLLEESKKKAHSPPFYFKFDIQQWVKRRKRNCETRKPSSHHRA